MRCLALLLVCAAAVRAQDPFEIHVYEYEPLPLARPPEAHLNYFGRHQSVSRATRQHKISFTTVRN